MRFLAGLGVLVGMVIGLHGAARGQPSPDRCGPIELTPLTFDRVGHGLTLAYAAEASAVATTSGDATADASLGVGLTYGAVFGRSGHDAYQIVASVSAAARRVEGTLATTGASTHAAVAVGPALVRDGETSHPRTNRETFPFTFELVHDGALAALPRLSARPDLRRDPYSWQRAELTTRALREEGQSRLSHGEIPKGPSDWNLDSTAGDLLSLRAAVELTSQDSEHLETTVGAALMTVTSHGVEPLWFRRFSALEFERRMRTFTDGQHANVDTLWMLRMEAARSPSSTGYAFGVGLTWGMPEADAVRREFGNKHGDIAVLNFGWWHGRPWGGVGWGFVHEPYVTMDGQSGVEDRATIEAARYGVIDLHGQAFYARTYRVRDGVWSTDDSGGLALDAHHRLAGLDLTLSAEVGRTFYGALDGAAPTLGLAARATFTIRAAGDHAWSW